MKEVLDICYVDYIMPRQRQKKQTRGWLRGSHIFESVHLHW